MSSVHQSVCPDCGFSVSSGTRYCPHCGTRLGLDSPPPALINFTPKNPNQQGLIVISSLAGLFLLLALTGFGLMFAGQEHGLLTVLTFIAIGLFAIFAIAWLAAVVGGWRQVRQVRSFLTSDRPLLWWTYTPEEWQEIRELIWQEERGDWQIQLGCMTFLFGLIGLMIGAMIGMEEGLEEMILGGVGGTIGGALVGGLMGGVIAVSHHLAARQAYHRTEPGVVALAPHEIYANDQYFRGNGDTTYLKRAKLFPAEPDVPPRLQVELKVPPKPRSPTDEEWTIIVPPRLTKAVEAVIPHLTDQTKS